MRVKVNLVVIIPQWLKLRWLDLLLFAYLMLERCWGTGEMLARYFYEVKGFLVSYHWRPLQARRLGTLQWRLPIMVFILAAVTLINLFLNWFLNFLIVVVFLVIYTGNAAATCSSYVPLEDIIFLEISERWTKGGAAFLKIVEVTCTICCSVHVDSTAAT